MGMSLTATSIATPVEILENGTRATTPAGDNLLLDFNRAEIVANAAIAACAGGRSAVVDALGLHMNDAGSASPFGNVAHVGRPIADDELADLASALRDFYGSGHGGQYLLFSAWPIGDLGRFGLGLAGHPPFMVRPAGGAAPLAAGLRIVEATTAATVADFERTIVDAYPIPEMAPFGSQPRLFGDGLLGTSLKLFVGYADGIAVGTAAASVGEHVVAVEAVSTRSSHRGRGFGAAITAAAMLAAPELPSALVASDLGRGVYAQLGFMPISRHTLWVGTR